MNLADQSVFITGASHGIGASCARAFAREGARLILAARRRSRLEAVAAELASESKVPVLLLTLDTRRPMGGGTRLCRLSSRRLMPSVVAGSAAGRAGDR